MSRDKVDELMQDAVRQLQKLAKDQGFKRLPDEKAFMDELSGEDDAPRIIVRRRFTTLSDAELAEARVWWEGLTRPKRIVMRGGRWLRSSRIDRNREVGGRGERNEKGTI